MSHGRIHPLLTWPTALPVAALRVLRTAAGRRALRVAVLVGGLFTLGFLCGEQAHAAEGAPPVTSASVTSSVVVPADPVPPPLTDGVVRSLGDRVVQVLQVEDRQVQADALAVLVVDLDGVGAGLRVERGGVDVAVVVLVGVGVLRGPGPSGGVVSVEAVGEFLEVHLGLLH